ncbi:MAG: hypothetical protein ACTHN3_10895 [Solirubrobacterales bacterium]
MRRRIAMGAFVNHWFAKAPLLLALALACALPSAAKATEPLRMTNVRVEGGEANWHSENAFRLDWDQIPAPPVYPRAVLYRLYDSEGHLVDGPVRNTKTLLTIDPLRVPPTPGVYTVEAWLEDAEGNASPTVYATLRFDDVAPPAPAPVDPASWSNTHEQVPLEIGHPPGPLPISGIRGYAISLDEGSGSSPCARPNWCSLAETDLPGGIDDDAIALGPLPEGETFARVVAVSGSGVASPVATALLRVDGTVPRLSLQGLPSGWSDGPVKLSVLATDALSGMAATGPSGPYAAISVDGGPSALSFGDTISKWVSGSGAHTVSYFARDAAGNANNGLLGTGPESAVVWIDEEPPRVLFAPAQDPAEPERIEATVSDALSGPSPDRGAIRLRPAGAGTSFRELPTRVVGDRLIAHWDSDAYPPGDYEFEATGYDRAGNATAGRTRAGGAEMILASPLKTPVVLEAGFGGRQLVWQRCSRSRQGRRCRRQRVTSFDARPATRTVPFGHGVRFGGRLRNAAGTPLGGQEVTVVETFAAGAEPRERTTLVRTEGDGAFSVQLGPGPSRDVSVRFSGTPTLSRTVARSVHLGVRAAVRLRASAATAQVGGAPVVFSGSVDRTSATGPVQGLPVELQFRYPGGEWSEFRTVEADAHGRFRYAYRFSDDDSRGVRFQFRAYVNGREGWPYEPAYSRPLAVLGR